MRSILLFVLLYLTSYTFGAGVSGDTFKIGKGTSTDKAIELGDTMKIKANYTSGALEFSNDGSLFKKLGSGSGTGGSGGINLLLNNSFEDGLGNWTSSGGTLTQGTYASSIEGDTKYANFISTVPGEYVESDCYTKPDNISGGGMADIKYLGGENFDLKVIDCTDANPLNHIEISTGTLGAVTEWLKSPTQTFSLPTKLKTRVISTAAGSISFDTAYLGSNKGFISGESHNKVVSYTPSFVGFGVPTAVNFNYQIVGEYILIEGIFTSGTQTSEEYKIGLPSGFTADSLKPSAIPNGQFFWSADKGGNQYAVGADPSNSYLNIFYQGDTGGYTKIVTSAPIAISGTTYYLSARIPVNAQSTTTQEAYTPEQADFFISANIGGENISTSITSTPLTAQGANLDMVLNKGSAKIPCSGSNPSTGLTCSSGNEVIGIVFNAPSNGKYKACFSFEGVDAGNPYFRLAETSSNSETILQQGKSIGGGGGVAQSVRLCDTFDFNSTGEKAIRLFYEGTGASSINMNRDSVLYERDLHVTVEMVGHNVSRPIIQNMVSTSVGNGIRIETCKFNNSSYPVAISDTCSSWIDSFSVVSTANNRVNFKTGIFSSVPECSGIPIYDGSTRASLIVHSESVNGATFYSYETTGGVDHYSVVNITCKGAR